LPQEEDCEWRRTVDACLEKETKVSNLPTLPYFLESHVTNVVSVTVANHDAGQSPAAWLKKFPQCDPVVALEKRFGATPLTRHDLFQLGNAARQGGDKEARELVAATFIFGSGRRYSRGHATKALASLNVPKVTAAVLNALESASLVRLYEAFTSKPSIEGYGESFFTKYLYFLTRDLSSWPSNSRPLIYDERVRRTLAFAKTTLGAEWSPPSSASARYEYYCQALGSWSGLLSGLSAGGSCEPDQIEYFLYVYAKKGVFSSSKYFRDLARAAIKSVSSGAIDPSLAAVVAALPNDFKASL
jgi:hypothetical protein